MEAAGVCGTLLLVLSLCVCAAGGPVDRGSQQPMCNPGYHNQQHVRITSLIPECLGTRLRDHFHCPCLLCKKNAVYDGSIYAIKFSFHSYCSISNSPHLVVWARVEAHHQRWMIGAAFVTWIRIFCFHNDFASPSMVSVLHQCKF